MRISTEGLVVRYPGQAAPALDGVSIDVPGGMLYAVLGPNGSGKSTLMRALMGLIPAESGRACIDGKDARQWSRKELARTVGAVAQSEPIAFPLRVQEMVAMGRYPHLGPLAGEGIEDRTAIERALDQCDVRALADRDVSTLSGGELQRVRIARALAQEPRALVLDEPTASLDVRHQMAILELLRSSADSGLTVLLVTHGLDLAARFADEMLLLSQGRVVVEGPPEVVMDASVLTEVYGWPVAVHADPHSGSPRITPLRSDESRAGG
jgi:ABC-type cobalamin/Fe3+-siderophores transport system ATPase subunit